MSIDPRVIELYNDYAHGQMPRRSFLASLTGLLGSAAAVSAVLPLIEPRYAQAQQIADDDSRITTGYIEYAGSSGAVRGYLAKPADASGALPTVLVIHENRGLNAHLEDVARRLATVGYLALAPDGLSVAGGAPADQEAARDLFAATDRNVIAADILAAVPFLAKHEAGNGKVGAVGFCYGGGMALRCAAEHPDVVLAGVCFYGSGLDAAATAKVKGRLSMHYAGIDPRINAGIDPFRALLDSAGVSYSLHMYPGTQHGFHNDATAARYDRAAAMLAWERTLAEFEVLRR
jgi:carboxymethylenebutenolidase